MADNKTPLPALAQLRQMLAKCSGKLADGLKAASDAVTEVADAKADKVDIRSLTIPAEGWQTDSAAYPQYVDIDVSGLTAADTVCVLVPSGTAADAAGLYGLSESRVGKLRIRAKYTPTAAIPATYYIVR